MIEVIAHDAHADDVHQRLKQFQNSWKGGEQSGVQDDGRGGRGGGGRRCVMSGDGETLGHFDGMGRVVSPVPLNDRSVAKTTRTVPSGRLTGPPFLFKIWAWLPNDCEGFGYVDLLRRRPVQSLSSYYIIEA